MARRISMCVARRVWLVACVLLIAWGGHAEAAPACMTVILVQGLVPAVSRGSSAPSLEALVRRGAVGLIAMPVRATRSEASAALSLACGVPVIARETDVDIHLGDEIVEGTTARNVLQRRAGTVVSPREAVAVHLGVAGLAERGLLAKLLGARLISAGVRVPPEARLVPESGYMARLAALVATDERGVARLATETDGPLVVLHADSSPAVLERVLRPLVRDPRRTVWVVGLPEYSQGNGFAVPPAFTVLSGPDLPTGLLTSATTRTPGLISFSDVSATLVDWYTQRPSTTGKPVTVLRSASPMDRVQALDGLARSNTAAMVPVLALCGGFAALGILMGLAAVAGYRHYGRSGLMLTRWAMALPIAFLVAGPVVEASRRQVPWPWYFVLVAAVSAAVALIYQGMANLVPRSMGARRFTVAALAATSAVIVLDGLAGQPMIKASLLAACGMSGIRFYGVGNEYMAVLVGCVLGLVYLLRARPWHSVVLGTGLTLFFGLGTIGANAGGVVTSVSSFLLVWKLLRNGYMPRRVALILLPLAGLAVAFMFAEVDARFFGQSSSHLGGALQAAREAGVDELVDIAGRKLVMNLGILTGQPALMTILALTVLASAAGTALRGYLREFEERFPEWVAWRPAALYAAAVAFVFNDTGVVAGLFVAGVWAMTGFCVLLEYEFGSRPFGRAGSGSGRIPDDTQG